MCGYEKCGMLVAPVYANCECVIRVHKHVYIIYGLDGEEKFLFSHFLPRKNCRAARGVGGEDCFCCGDEVLENE